MPVSAQSAVQQLRNSDPVKFKNLTDEEVYRYARRNYPNEDILDWPDANYTAPKPLTDVDPFEKQKSKTSENDFMDIFNFYGIDDESPFLARLAYSRSLQGMADDLMRGEERFTFDRQPELYEEALAGIASFIMPLDLLSMGIGSIGAKALLKSPVGKSLIPSASKYITKAIAPTMPKIKPSTINATFNNVLAAEARFIPFEAAKSNLYARTLHMRDPSIEGPLSSDEIMKETYAGIVHGGIMGVMGGVASPFLAAKHSRILNVKKRLESQKVLTGQSQKQLETLTKAMKFTGKGAQFATDVGMLTAGDVVGTQLAYGQTKTIEEMFYSLATMGTFRGVMGVMNFGLDKTVLGPIERANTAYREAFDLKSKELESLQNVADNVNSKSKAAKDSQVEAQKTSNSTDDLTDSIVSDIAESRKKFEESSAGKTYEKLKLKVQEHQAALKGMEELGEDPAKMAKFSQQFLQKNMELFLEVIEYVDNSPSKTRLADVDEMISWKRSRNEQANNILAQSQANVASEARVLAAKLQSRGVKTISFDIDNSGVRKDYTIEEFGAKLKEAGKSPEEINLIEAQIFDEKLKTLGDADAPSADLTRKETSFINEIRESDDTFESKINSLKPGQQQSNLKESLKASKEIEDKINKVRNKEILQELSDDERKIAISNYKLINTFVRQTDNATQTKGVASYQKYVKEIIKFADWMTEKYPGSKINDTRLSDWTEFVTEVNSIVRSGALKKLADNFKTYEILANRLNKTTDESFLLQTAKGKDFKESTKAGISAENVKDDLITVTMSKVGAEKKIPIQDVKSKSTAGQSGESTKTLINSIKNLVKKTANQVIGEDKKLHQILFFARTKTGEKGKAGAADTRNFDKNSAISSTTFTQLSKSIFGIGGSDFRKAMSTWVSTKYGPTSKQAALVDLFGLGHAQSKNLEKVQQAYIADLKENSELGFKEYSKLLKEFQKVVFDSKNSIKLEQMFKNKSFKQLKKYGISDVGLKDKTGVTVHQLKKGFERLTELKKLADSDDFISFTTDGTVLRDVDLNSETAKKSISFRIHKDVLEGMFRTALEGSTRITELFAITKNFLNVPVTGTPKSIQQKPIESLLRKIKFGVGSEIDDDLISLSGDKLVRPKNETNKLTISSDDSIDKLKQKASVLIKDKDFDAPVKTGDEPVDRSNEKIRRGELNLLLRVSGLTKLEAAKVMDMKNIDIKKMLNHPLVDEGVLNKITKNMECG